MENNIYKKISISVEKEFIGLTGIIEKVDLSTLNIDDIKEIIKNKSISCANDEKDFYNSLYKEISDKNLLDIMKKIDTFLYNKKRKQKEMLAKKLDKRVEESKNKDMSDFIIQNKVSFEEIKEILKDYIYIYSKKNKIVYLYLLNNIELKKERNGINEIHNRLKNINIDLKVIVVDKNSPLDKMTIKERADFKDFFKNY